MDQHRAGLSPTAGVMALSALVLLTPATAHGQGGALVEAGDGVVDHSFIVGVGGAVEVELQGGAVRGGGNLMFEWTAVEHWLELELEVSVLSAEGGIEVPVALLAKKPFRLTPRIELMLGLGPQVVRVSNPTTKATYWGIEVVADLMVWPWEHVGFWLEPSYDLTFRAEVSHGVGCTGGLLFGW